MKLSELINTLNEIKNSNTKKDPTVHILHEEEIGERRGAFQFEHGVTDIALADWGVILIGKELK